MSAVSSRWFWMDKGRQAGPVTWDELQQLARTGRLKPEGMVLREGSRNWQAAKSARDVKDGSSFTGPMIFGLCILLSAFGTPRKRA